MHATHPTITAPDIATLAYRLWEEAGRPDGRDQEFWFTAEHQLSALANVDNSPAAAGKRPAQPRAPRKRHD